MKEKRTKLIVAAVAYIIIGLILLIFPTLTAKVVAYVFATVMLLAGIYGLISYFTSRPELTNRGLYYGLLAILIAIFIYSRINLVISIVPVLLGFSIALSALMTFQQTIDMLRLKLKGWIPMLVVAILNLVLGILVILNPFASAAALMSIVGIGLLFSGISDIVAILYISDKLKRDFY